MFSTIITSSVWDEDSDTKVVWVTMLALQDQYHEVHASVPGLARMAKVSRAACEKALSCFLAPDKDSRTKAEEGRRILQIEGGWKIINGQKYRDLMSADERREYKRVHEAKRREKLKERGPDVDKRGQSMDSGGQKTAETETKTDAEVKTEVGGVPPTPLKRADAVAKESPSSAVEPPPGFPRNEDEAVAMAGNIPPGFTRMKYDEAVGIGYKNWNGKPIFAFARWISGEYAKQQSRNEEKGIRKRGQIAP